MYKIAIIDDEMNGETNRKEFYKEMFTDTFDVVAYISEPSDMIAAHNLEVHAYILDLVYEDEKYNGITFDVLVNNINNKKNVPIFLISSKWETFKLPLNAKKLCNLKNIVSCIGWNELTLENKNFLVNSINESINRFFNYTSVIKSQDETIKLLQLSDLQFGDEGVAEAFNCADIALVNYLNDTNMVPDILVITGDIAANGKKNEYQLALKWINDFGEELWGSNVNWKEKIVVIPGNHDVDYKQCLLDFYDISFDGEPKLVKKDKNNDEYQRKSMLNYAEFVSELTGIDYYFRNYDNLFHVNERFLKWGLRFYEFNTAQSINPIDTKKINITKDNYAEMKKYTLNNGNKEVFNILLSHYCPEDVGYRQSDTNMMKNWNAMRSFIDAAKINMFMCGHVHKSEIRKMCEKRSMSEYAHNLIISTASTYSLNSASRAEDESRGFNIIELCRKDGKIYKVIGHLYDVKGAKVTENIDDCYEEEILLKQ